MENRAAIPVLALIGLSFTDCVDKPEPVAPIVGEWAAIQIDGEKLPVSYQDGPYSVVYGLNMEIQDDLAGDFAQYYDINYDGLHQRSEVTSDLVVDDSAAPKYRIEIAKNFLDGLDSFDTDYYGYTSVTGYAGTTYAGPLDDPDGPVPSRPITLPSAPNAAPAELVLNCTLDADILACESEDMDVPTKFVFKRKTADGA